MRIEDIICKHNKEIITVVGAGGKTSFINHIAKYYRDKAKVLLTTTTKIYLPKKDDYDKIFITDNNLYHKELYSSGITVAGKYINKENKIIGLDFDDIKKLEKSFNLILIEGDGSKKKKLKGWRAYEPVVYPKTNKTIGIVDITSIGMEINSDNIHNLKEFRKITEDNEDIVNINHLKKIILHESGLFKNSVGEKIVFLNKIEDEETQKLAAELINLIKKENKDLKLYYGSILKNYIREVW